MKQLQTLVAFPFAVVGALFLLIAKLICPDFTFNMDQGDIMEKTCTNCIHCIVDRGFCELARTTVSCLSFASVCAKFSPRG